MPFGEERDVAYQTCNLQGAVPGSLTVSGEAYISTTFGYTQKHVGRNIGVLIAFTALYLIPTIIASEIMQFGGGGGGMTIFARTKHAKAKLAAAAPTAAGDTEAAAATQSPRSIESDDTRAHSSSNGKEAEKLAEHRGRSIEDRAIFTWKDLSLELDSGRKLLQNVDGYVRPGTMTALMGASGAGKTTLLTTLSQRTMFGSISGEVLVDGKPLGLGFQKGTGFVLQGDVHLATQTVREAIEFSALLRQPAETPREEKLADAERALRLLELEDLQDALIGVPGAGLGVERRKRVTIAVELAAKPDLLLFLDEPTSGLDSAGAASICRLLRRLAEEEGQAILCTIHQPSALLFESFDNLLLLKPGGATAYFGQIGEKRGRDSDKVRTYFEAHGGPSCAPDANVAEYMLEVVSNNKNNDWARVWQESPNRDELRKEIDSIKAERSQRPANQDSRELSEFSANAFTQIVEVTKRQLKDVWRDSAFAYGILFSNFVVGLVAGGAFAHLGYSPTEYQNRVFIAFLVLLQFPAVVNAIIAKFFEIRVLFEVREGPSKTYAWYALVTSFIISTAPIAIVASVIYFFREYIFASWLAAIPPRLKLTSIPCAASLNLYSVVLHSILQALCLCRRLLLPHGSPRQPFRDPLRIHAGRRKSHTAHGCQPASVHASDPLHRFRYHCASQHDAQPMARLCLLRQPNHLLRQGSARLRPARRTGHLWRFRYCLLQPAAERDLPVVRRRLGHTVWRLPDHPGRDQQLRLLPVL